MTDVHSADAVTGRDHERAVLRDLVSGARAGQSGGLVVHGEAGIGKTTLLEEARSLADGFLILQVAGIESESGVGFAALHRLLSPLSASWRGLPAPQRRALEFTFGLGDGPAPDRFLVGLAALTLLDDAACQQPVLCLVDDGQWLDSESLFILSFVARRLEAESVAMLFAFREAEGGATELPEGLPRLPIGPLGADDAERLLHSVVTSQLDPVVSERVLDQCGGSPLAIVELSSALTPEQLISVDLLPLALPVGERLERHFISQVDALPVEARTVLLIAAVDTTGDAATVLGAAADLGLGPGAAEPAEASGLVRLAPDVAFRHPLVRSAIVAAAAPSALRQVNAALARTLEGDHLGETRVWHLAAATVGNDDAVADALDERAEIAALRASPAAEAALRTRSAELTSDPAQRASRQIKAAYAHLFAGSPQRAAQLVDSLSEAAESDLVRAQVIRVRALLASFATPGPVPQMLLDAAELARRDDPALARVIETEAIQASLVSCQCTEGVTPGEIAERVLETSPEAEDPRDVVDLLRVGFASRLTKDHSRAARLLDLALDRAGEVDDDGLRELEYWTVFVNNLPAELWDVKRTGVLLDRVERRERERGALESLRITLGAQAHILMWKGQFSAAEAAHGEASAIAVALGGDSTRWEVLKVELYAWKGEEETVRFMADVLTGPLTQSSGSGVAMNIARSALMILGLGLGRYEDALEVGRLVMDDDFPPQGNHCLPDVVEAGVRCHELDLAATALARLEDRVASSSNAWSTGLLARSRALLDDGSGAERHYVESIQLLGRSEITTELARSHLLFGEWLRRRNRRLDAREHLRAAHALFSRMGARAFEDRTRVELAATGERARRRTVDTANDLTPQEMQIALLAAQGLTNREISASLFVSASTVDYHLRKVFRKLGVSSRRKLGPVLAH